MKKIGIFTGSRANYSSTKTIIRAIDNDSELELISIVGGAATLQRYGEIDKIMVQEGLPKPDFVFNMFLDGGHNSDMVKSLGLGLLEMSSVLRSVEIDGLIVVGDRYDILAAATAAAFMNIPVIHTMGGEVTGTIDESIRHAVTKFAHLHLVANDDARNRVEKLGEPPDSIFSVGCPRMDLVREAIATDQLTSEIFWKKYPGVGARIGIDEQFLIASFHPVTSESDSMRAQVLELLEALDQLAIPTVMLWPNFDAGSNDVTKTIRTFREKNNPKWLNLQTNLSVEDYSRLLNRSACLVGNSSSGVREGAFIGTPVVNIGSRQNGRLASENVIHTVSQKGKIINAIQSQLKHGKYVASTLYGDGFTAQRIIQILKVYEIGSSQKIITY